MPKETNKVVLNLIEAAAYLGISPPTLLALLQGSSIPYRRAGQRWLISKAALDEWLTHPDIKAERS